ncbi:MAG: alpha/beta fold hydrolase [Bacteroidaceae bacterium]|nr:alpha/beta fold hydrolase [Bacteroidaceae bacterium]
MKRTVFLCLLSLCCILYVQAQQHDLDTKYATELIKKGTAAPNFTLKTPQSTKIQLAKISKGHYTVLDFWASWCPDCRKDLPNLQRIYKRFAPYGVEFVGVSFDTNKEAWQNAIDKYDIRYTQVSDLKNMRESQVVADYGVKWIPSMVLLDPEGKVVLSTVLSDKLEKTLYELIPETYEVESERETVSIDGDHGQLSAVIQRPPMQAGEQCPMVILCHGFGGNKEGQMFDLIADTLCRHGIASIRFDFNGHGESDGEFQQMTIPNEVVDARKVYEYVRDLRYVSKVGIVGHSQGGVVTAMLAGQLSEQAGAEPSPLSAVVLLAPAGTIRNDCIRGSFFGQSFDPLDPPAYLPLFGDRMRLGQDYIKTAFRLPIYETAAHYHGPAAIIHGTADRLVPYTYGLRFHQQWTGSEYYELDGQDHGFTQNLYHATNLASDFLVRTLK